MRRFCIMFMDEAEQEIESEWFDVATQKESVTRAEELFTLACRRNVKIDSYSVTEEIFDEPDRDFDSGDFELYSE